jgi:hypothetical protein
MKGAASRRTEIAHAHVMDGAAGPMRLHLFGEKATLAPLDQDFINRTIDQFHTLATDILTLSSYIGALAPEILKPKLEAIYAPIDAQLQRLPEPPRRRRLLGKAARDASEKRLGIDPNIAHGIYLSVERHMPIAGFPKP